jgi:haloacetate dehalogenase
VTFDAFETVTIQTSRTSVEAGGPLGLWRRWADDVRGDAVAAGHFFPEERPDQTAERLRGFLESGK